MAPSSHLPACFAICEERGTVLVDDLLCLAKGGFHRVVDRGENVGTDEAAHQQLPIDLLFDAASEAKLVALAKRYGEYLTVIIVLRGCRRRLGAAGFGLCHVAAG